MSTMISRKGALHGPAARFVRRFGHFDEGAWAVVAVVMLVGAATLSGSNDLAVALVAGGSVLGLLPVWRRRDDTIVRLALAVVVAWTVYGFAVGSMPTPWDLHEVERFVSTEGRVLVSVATIMIARGVRGADIRRGLVAIVWLVTVVHLIALAFYLLGSAPPVFSVSVRGLFQGFSSSHHVVGFVAAVVLTVAACIPRWFPGWRLIAVVGIAVWTVLLSGSRASVLGLICAFVLIGVRRLEGRRLLAAAIAFVVLGGVAVASNARLRTTADVITRPEFSSEVWRSWNNGTTRGIRNMSNSAPEANLLLRVARWGMAWESFEQSPVIGIGAFRQNDFSLEYVGEPGLVWVATDGLRRHSDNEPHNVGFYLLQEVGVLGFALFASPYLVAWTWGRRAQRPRGSTATADPPGGATGPDGDGLDAATVAALGLLAQSTILVAVGISFVSSGVMATGLGLAANAVIFTSCGVGERRREPALPTRIEVDG